MSYDDVKPSLKFYQVIGDKGRAEDKNDSTNLTSRPSMLRLHATHANEAFVPDNEQSIQNKTVSKEVEQIQMVHFLHIHMIK